MTYTRTITIDYRSYASVCSVKTPNQILLLWRQLQAASPLPTTKTTTMRPARGCDDVLRAAQWYNHGHRLLLSWLLRRIKQSAGTVQWFARTLTPVTTAAAIIRLPVLLLLPPHHLYYYCDDDVQYYFYYYCYYYYRLFSVLSCLFAAYIAYTRHTSIISK